ncbi:MAG TPA: polyphosphate kinase 2 family protein [Geobacteraceae bacterium]|nr:polyphosphate kinase 2 family protein [Geobacteraceae bacterium]
MNYLEMFRIEHNSDLKLDKIDPDFKDKHEDKASAEEEIAKHIRELRELQYLLYAEGKRSLLVCLQALDAAGKDGTINHVLGGMNPQGCRVYGFKGPSKEELAHDFLWRIHARVPARGEVAIFNRSHYEDVLVARVHNLVPKEVWSERYEIINNFEKGLLANGTHIVKIFLHISAEEQLRRFKQRLDDPSRHWKISEFDYSERKLWPEYRKAYEEAIGRTSTRHAPWYVVPANHKWFRNLAVSNIIVHTLKSLDMKFPEPTVDIEKIRRQYHAAEEEQNHRNRD